MRLTININDNKALQLVDFLRTLDFVSIESESKPYPLSEKEIQLLNDRLEEYKKNPGSTEDFDSAIDEIEKEV